MSVSHWFGKDQANSTRRHLPHQKRTSLFHNNIQGCEGCLIKRKSRKKSRFVGWGYKRSGKSVRNSLRIKEMVGPDGLEPSPSTVSR